METPVNMMRLPSWAQDRMALQTRHTDAIEWLQTNVKSEFWCELKTWFEENNETHRTDIAGYYRNMDSPKRNRCGSFAAMMVQSKCQKISVGQSNT